MTIEIAWDPATPPDHLHVLLRARSRAVRSAVAGNPNTSLTDLDVLCRHFAEGVASNPVLDWLTITDADWLETLSEPSRHRLLASSNCPAGLLWWAVRFGEDDDRIAVTANPACPPEVLVALDGETEPDTDDTVVQSARLNHNAPSHGDSGAVDGGAHDADLDIRAGFAEVAYLPELADLLAGDLVPAWIVGALGVPADPEARRELARSPYASRGVLDALLGDDDDGARRIASANERTDQATVELWDRLCTDDPTLSWDELEAISVGSYGRERVARHPNVDSAALRAFVEDSSWRVREAAAKNPRLSLEQIAKLAVDSDRDVRAAAVVNERLPISAAFALSLDADPQVRVAARARVDAHGVFQPDDPLRASSDALATLFRRTWAMRFDFTAYALTTTTSMIEPFVSDADAMIRLAFVSNPTLPSDAVRLFASDPDSFVRAKVAERVDDVDLLAEFVGDIAADVRTGAARNLALPGWLAARLGADQIDDVRVALVCRADLADVVLAQLLDVEPSDSLLGGVRRLICGHRGENDTSAPTDDTTEHEAYTRAVTFAVQYPWLAMAAVRRPDLDNEALVAFAGSPHWRVREAVAAHAGTPDVALRQLVTDPDNDVRSAVAANRAVDPAQYSWFVSETDDKVRRALLNRPDLASSLVAEHLVGDEGIRSDARAHPNLPPDMAAAVDALGTGAPLPEETLRQFASGSARRLVVNHPSATAEILHSVAADPNWIIREAVANHENTSSDDLIRLASDSDRDVRAAVAANPRCPSEVLRVLMNDDDHRVKRSAIANANAASEARQAWANETVHTLLRSHAPVARAIALLHPMGEHILRRPRYRRSIHWVERWAIASNPHTPGWVRATLADDANVLVQRAAGAVR